jgi:hypothetical protein
MITLHPLVVHQAIDLQNPESLGINQKGKIFDEMGPPLIRGEIDHDHLFLFILVNEIRRIPNDSKHPPLFFSILF